MMPHRPADRAPGGDPSGVYYATDTHASALLIGAALALAWPLPTLAAVPAAHDRRLDIDGVIDPPPWPGRRPLLRR